MLTEKKTLNLGHLAIPQGSTGQAWLTGQSEQRQKALKVVEETTREWLGSDFAHLPDIFFEMFADRIVTDLDHRV